MTARNRAQELWLLFGGLSLCVAGALSLPVSLGKIPALEPFLPTLVWTQWSLVIHVILALVVWHLSVPVALCYSFSREPSERMGSCGVHVCAAGALLLFVSFPSATTRPVLNNYIPVITNSVFFVGLFLCLIGILMGFLGSKVLYSKKGQVEGFLPLRLGALIYLVALFVLLMAFISRGGEFISGNFAMAEQVMWGAGHLFQHLSSVFLLVSWNILLSSGQKSRLPFKKEILPSFVYLGLGIAPAFYLAFLPVTGLEYRQGFTFLMRWGIFPAFILFYLQLWRHREKVNWKKVEGFRLLAFGFSSILLIAGFVFGALIDGNNLKVPGHYHATIGAITISFMAMFVQLTRHRFEIHKLRAKIMFISYGVGQSLFAGGLFAAGVFNVERKTYGGQLEAALAGQKTALKVVAAGGVLALCAGALFALVVYSAFRGGNLNKKQTVASMDAAHEKVS